MRHFATRGNCQSGAPLFGYAQKELQLAAVPTARTPTSSSPKTPPAESTRLDKRQQTKLPRARGTSTRAAPLDAVDAPPEFTMRVLWLLTCVLTFFSAAGMFESDALRTLGLRKGATPEEIKKAYKRLAREHHPDKGGDSDAIHQNPRRLREPFSSRAARASHQRARRPRRHCSQRYLGLNRSSATRSPRTASTSPRPGRTRPCSSNR